MVYDYSCFYFWVRFKLKYAYYITIVIYQVKTPFGTSVNSLSGFINQSECGIGLCLGATVCWERILCCTVSNVATAFPAQSS